LVRARIGVRVMARSKRHAGEVAVGGRRFWWCHRVVMEAHQRDEYWVVLKKKMNSVVL